MYCKNCGKEIKDDSSFCPECGSPISPSRSKKKISKKPIYKKWWFWVIVVFFVIGIFSGPGHSESEPSETINSIAETSAAKVPDTTPITSVATIPSTTAEEDTIPTESTIPEMPTSTVAGLIEMALKENFTDYSIEYEDDIISVGIWQDGISAGATLALAGNQECIDSWNQMVENEIELCSGMKELADNFGRSDITIMLNVLNDLNTENVLLSIVNGSVFYDAVNSQE